MNFQPGDRVRSPTYGNGIVQPPPWSMPQHTLVQFDCGNCWWILNEILTPAKAEEVKPKQSRRKKKAAA